MERRKSHGRKNHHQNEIFSINNIQIKYKSEVTGETTFINDDDLKKYHELYVKLNKLQNNENIIYYITEDDLNIVNNDKLQVHVKSTEENKHTKSTEEKIHNKSTEEKKHNKSTEEKKHNKSTEEKKHNKSTEEKKHNKSTEEKKHAKPIEGKKISEYNKLYTKSDSSFLKTKNSHHSKSTEEKRQSKSTEEKKISPYNKLYAKSDNSFLRPNKKHHSKSDNLPTGSENIIPDTALLESLLSELNSENFDIQQIETHKPNIIDKTRHVQIKEIHIEDLNKKEIDYDFEDTNEYNIFVITFDNGIEKYTGLPDKSINSMYLVDKKFIGKVVNYQLGSTGNTIFLIYSTSWTPSYIFPIYVIIHNNKFTVKKFISIFSTIISMAT
jgi:hypothetical protein